VDKDAEIESVSVAYTGESSRVLVSYLGKAGKAVDLSGLRKAATAAVTKLRALKVASASIEIPVVDGIPPSVVAATVVQAAILTNYTFDRYLTLEDKKSNLVTSLHFKCTDPEQVAHA